MAIRKKTRAGKPVLVIDIPYRKPDGSRDRYRRDALVQTMAAARLEERRLLAEIATRGEIRTRGEPAVRSYGFGDAVELFRKTALATKKPSTRKGYEEVLEGILARRFGKLALGAVGMATVQPLDVDLIRSGVSASRRRNVQVVLRSVLRTAVEHGMLEDMPRLPKLPRVGGKVIEAPTWREVTAILAVASPAARLAFALSAYAGLRRGEVRALRWSDVDLDGKVIVVRRSLSHGVESPPKSGHERAVPIAAPLLKLLRSTPRASPWLVTPSSTGRAWGEASLLANFRRCCVRAGVRAVPFHRLRHFFVTELFRRGVPAHAVQALAGHGSLTVTQRYAHVAASDLRAAIARLG